MIGVIYISSQVYGKDPLEQECNKVGFSVGYHGVVGEAEETTTKKSAIGTQGYGIGNSISPMVFIEGCMQSEDGVLATLTLIEAMCIEYSLTSLVVITPDPYLIKVSSHWMPDWKEHAVKGNNQLIPNDTEWMRVFRLPIHFISQLEADYGAIQANIFSVTYTQWSTTYPAAAYINKPVKLSPLLHLQSVVFTPLEPTQDRLQLVSAKEIIEIGNMDCATVYGLVKTLDVAPLIHLCMAKTDLSPEYTYTLELATIKSDGLGSVLNRVGTKLLSKPVRYDEQYTIGLEGKLIAPIQPAHKLYKAEGIWCALDRLMDKLTMEEIPANTAEIMLLDVTQHIFPEGKVHPKLLANAKSMKVALPIGKARSLDVGTELPTLLALRPLAKAGARIYTGAIKIEGIYRYFYMLKVDGAIGLYTTWLTKLLPV